jgi:hypothetical protein
MGEILPFQASHVPEVAALHLKVIRKRLQPAGADLQRYFEEIFLGNPWRADDLPSLVYVHDGRVAGFLGVVPRRMLFLKRPVRVAVASQFMVDRDLYRGYAGLELLKRFFSGPQDLSLTDGATEPAYATWTASGARAAWLYSLEWTRIFRPVRYLRGTLEERKGKRRILGKLMTPAGAVLDAALRRVPARRLAAPNSPCQAEPVTADELLQAIERIGWRDPLKPCYDPETFRWLIAKTAHARSHGSLRLAVVRDSDREPVGWYVYFAKPGGISVVMQLGGKTHRFEEVLQTLLRDAWDQRSAAIRGQAIPRQLTSLTRNYCGLRHIGSGVLVHARDPDLLACILRGDAALSRLDGEWWMRFAIEDWDEAGP